MKNASNDIIEPYLYLSNNIITDTKEELVDFTGFAMNKFTGKTIEEELPFIDHLLMDNKVAVAIHSISELVLLKTNQKYLDFQDMDNNSVEKNLVQKNLGKRFKDRVNKFEGSKAEEIFKEIIRTGKSYYAEELEFEGFGKGVTYWDSIISSAAINGKAKYIVEIVSEVTERVLNRRIIEKQSKEIEEQKKFIKKQKEQLEAIIKGLGDEIVIVDKGGTYLSVSNLINNRINALGKNYRQVYDEVELYDLNGNRLSLEETCTARALKGEKVKNLKIKSVKDEKTRYIKSTGIPIFNKNHELEFVIGITHDITDEIKSNKSMEKTLKAQEEFLANISHELKTPLNVIFTTAQLFDMYCHNGSLDVRKDTIIKYIESIKQNSNRLSKLINNIVDSSKIEAGFFELNLSNNNIVEVVEEIVISVTDFTHSKGLNIIFDTDTEEKIIACDPEKIERIVLNLISNAIKFSTIGDEIFIEVKDKHKFVEISVKDNGIGIEDKYLEIIFDRFKQVDKSLSRNAEGTGIGLSLVKLITELHGGSVRIESEFGKGSKFTVVLPNKKVRQENIIFSSKIRNKDESILLEFSDIIL